MFILKNGLMKYFIFWYGASLALMTWKRWISLNHSNGNLVRLKVTYFEAYFLKERLGVSWGLTDMVFMNMGDFMICRKNNVINLSKSNLVWCPNIITYGLGSHKKTWFSPKQLDEFLYSIFFSDIGVLHYMQMVFKVKYHRF
jgi:hypothetical protein